MVDAEELQLQVLACPLVAGVHAGHLGTIVTPAPAGAVVGVRLQSDVIVIGVWGHEPDDETRLPAQVRAAVARHLSDRPVTVCVLPPTQAVALPNVPAASPARSSESPSG